MWWRGRGRYRGSSVWLFEPTLGLVARGTSRGGFEWWGPHDSTARRARVLFVAAAVIVALYLGSPLVLAALVVRVAEIGPWRGIASFEGRLGPVGLVGAAALLLAASASIIASVAWRGVPRTTLRLAGARTPTQEETQRVIDHLEGASLVNGISQPRCWVIDDSVPNALAFGNPAAGNVCITTGALELPRDELSALCMFQATALASRSFAYATSAVDLVLVAEWGTRVLWTTAVAGLLSALVGVSIEAGAGYTIGIVLVVLATRPVLGIANRALPRLLANTAELVDLDTVRHSAQPSALAHLLLRLLEDGRRTASAWQLTHRWFEADIIQRPHRAGRLGEFLVAIAPATIGIPPVLRHHVRSEGRSLLERAAIAVNLADGDDKLRRRLERAQDSH